MRCMRGGEQVNMLYVGKSMFRICGENIPICSMWEEGIKRMYEPRRTLDNQKDC
jgi:hypothetical protein